jgi:hypothetical protein
VPRLWGRVSRAAKGADCKSAGYAFAGSSPASPTNGSRVLPGFSTRHTCTTKRVTKQQASDSVLGSVELERPWCIRSPRGLIVRRLPSPNGKHALQFLALPISATGTKNRATVHRVSTRDLGDKIVQPVLFEQAPIKSPGALAEALCCRGVSRPGSRAADRCAAIRTYS